jgi:hypothetical protein
MEYNFFLLLILETELTSEHTFKSIKNVAVTKRKSVSPSDYMAVTVPVLPSGYKPYLVASGLWPKRRQIRPLYNARPVLNQTVTQRLREGKLCAVSWQACRAMAAPEAYVHITCYQGSLCSRKGDNFTVVYVRWLYNDRFFLGEGVRWSSKFQSKFFGISSSLRPSKTAVCFNIKLSTICKVIWLFLNSK